MNRWNRRQILGAGAMAGLGGLLGANSVGASTGSAPGGLSGWTNRIGVSTYSFWQFRGERLDIPACVVKAAEMGFDGVEILLVQMRETSNGTLQTIKRQVHSLGLDLMGLSTHQGFVSPDPERRRAEVAKTLEQIEIAYRLGIPTMRINTGRWGTSGSFDELMANRGIEPPLPGHDDEEAFGWVISSLEQLLPKAAECGVVLGLENHWGLGRTAAGVLRIVEAIDSPWLQITLDTGNFLDDSYAQMEAMASSRVPICLVQAKTYYGGGRWYALDLDYDRIAAILKDAGYRGYISLEFEGNDDAETAVPQSLELLRTHFG